VKLLNDKVLLGYVTIIVVVLIAALTILSLSNHEADVGRYIGVLTPAVTGLVVLLGVRPKTKEAAEAAAHFSDDQRAEIEAIVVQGLKDYRDGKLSSGNTPK
jgi:hypothetical protein